MPKLKARHSPVWSLPGINSYGAISVRPIGSGGGSQENNDVWPILAISNGNTMTSPAGGQVTGTIVWSLSRLAPDRRLRRMKW